MGPLFCLVSFGKAGPAFNHRQSKIEERGDIVEKKIAKGLKRKRNAEDLTEGMYQPAPFASLFKLEV